MSSNWESAIAEELSQVNQTGSMSDNNLTDVNGQGTTSLGKYTNRIFGAPYQLLDSVDRRFSSVNSNLGTEYLRNVILNSPILYIRPGLPHYTGGDESLWESVTDMYADITSGADDSLNMIYSGAMKLVTNVVFGGGSKLQRRMFGLRETYNDYMFHVNYMLRSVAVFLGITQDTYVPSFTFSSSGSQISFGDAEWAEYRMIDGDSTTSPWTQFEELATEVAGTGSFGYSVISGTANAIGQLISAVGGNGFSLDTVMQAFGSWDESSAMDSYTARNTTVQFMVEPVALQESLSNQVEQSMIEQTIDTVGNTIGYELAFITGSNADIGMVGNLVEFLGNGVTNAATSVSSLMTGVTGGWINNIFNGGIRSLSGQKMIYPKIYKASQSSMGYEYTITLRSPYGDVYNYYMNIVVPLCHLISLAAPRMISSNSITSPYMVQAFIPGMSTCELGIISSMNIIKNPDANHVSVNGFPLTVKVTFTVSELYNSLSISPAHDPVSFLHNETLNDYLCNLGGLVPSEETDSLQRANSGAQFMNFMAKLDDALGENFATAIEDFMNIGTL